MSAKGKVVLASNAYEPPGSTGARTATPAILSADADNAADAALVASEQFGPISFIVATASTADGDRQGGRPRPRTRARSPPRSIPPTRRCSIRPPTHSPTAGVNLSCNLTGGIFVNQSAAFSDYHVSGANPAGNACLTDTAFVANRFRVAGVRRPAA